MTVKVFQPEQVKRVRLIELNADGTTNVDTGHYLTLEAIERLGWEQDIREREVSSIPTANADVEQRVLKKAKLFGLTVELAVRYELPYLESILLDETLVMASTNVIGSQMSDFGCKEVILQAWISGVAGDCTPGSAIATRLFPKVGYWQKTEGFVLDAGKEVPVIVYQGYAQLNPNFDDAYTDGEWLTSPAKITPASAFSSGYVSTSITLPAVPLTGDTGPAEIRFDYAVTPEPA